MSIDTNRLAAEVLAALNGYAETTVDAVKEAAAETAEDCVRDLKATSPARTGKYRKGWRAKKAFESGLAVRYTVHNKTRYRLTHLLEKGHAKRGGGRTAAIPHIAPAERRAIDAFYRRVRRSL